jgi:hypothetical protein
MKARIYKPAKTAMQSGRGNTRNWLLEYEPEAKRSHDPLMGWTSSSDTRQQVKLRFETKEDALAFCKRQKLTPEIQEPGVRKIRPKNYAANFRWDANR